MRHKKIYWGHLGVVGMNDPEPPNDVVDELREEWNEETFDRVMSTILGTSEYTWHREIAEIANCSENSAKKHLDRLVDMGLVQRKPNPNIALYRRNDAYFEWRAVDQAAEQLSAEEIAERVEQLENRREDFEDKFGSANPTSVSVFDAESENAIHERMKEIGEWQGIE